MNNQLIPTLLVHDEETFRDRLKLVEKDFKILQIDIMDGSFVPNRTWFDKEIIEDLDTPAKFVLDLMVYNPHFYIDETRHIDSIKRYIWHVEVKVNHITLINTCHDLKKEAGLSINPKTPIDALTPYAGLVDEILVMGAEPGYSGQKLQSHNIDRVREIKKRWPNISIGFDINVDAKTIPLLKEAGVSRFYSNSAIFNADDPLSAAKKLAKLI
ncbi:hypothetical protein KKE33_03065 [Patescibacteria group bacterium]|nr:hypothetical protein [Patescibacteria group bacterium]